MLMILAISNKMIEPMKSIYTKYMIQGFRDACIIAETSISGGQTVINPWPIIGGIATTVVPSDQYFIYPDRAQPGDVVLLTKPLGTQIAVNVHQWKNKYLRRAKMKLKGTMDTDKDNDTNNHEQEEKYWMECIEKNILTEEEANTMIHTAICCMVQLNKVASHLLHKYHAHACTDVTGFGIVGHAQNLMDNQRYNSTSGSSTDTDIDSKMIDDTTTGNVTTDNTTTTVGERNNNTNNNGLGINFHTFPCIYKTVAVNENILDFQLTSGYSAETSGGLLICLSSNEVAQLFITDLTTQLIKECNDHIITTNTNNNTNPILLPPPPQSINHPAAWIVGDVIALPMTTDSTTNNNDIDDDQQDLKPKSKNNDKNNNKNNNNHNSKQQKLNPSVNNNNNNNNKTKKISRVSILDDLKIIEIEYP